MLQREPRGRRNRLIRSKSIHIHTGEVLGERADFLWGLFAKHVDIRAKPHSFYLDVGTGTSATAKVFRDMMHFEFAVGVDLEKGLSTSDNRLMLLHADAEKLPFRENSFQMITMFSLIEHVPKPKDCLSEALRVLKDDGQLFMQFPNRYFPIEPHSGLPFYFYLPKRIRYWYGTIAGRPWMKETDIPSPRHVRKFLKMIQTPIQSVFVGFYYPESCLPDSGLVRFIYRLMKQLHVFRILPMGYVAFVSRQVE